MKSKCDTAPHVAETTIRETPKKENSLMLFHVSMHLLQEKKKLHLKACLNWYYDLQPKPRYLSTKGQPKRYHPKLFDSPTKPTLTLTSTTKYYSVLLCTTPYYKILCQYYSVLESATPVLFRTTKYYSSTTLYYKLLL